MHKTAIIHTPEHTPWLDRVAGNCLAGAPFKTSPSYPVCSNQNDAPGLVLKLAYLYSQLPWRISTGDVSHFPSTQPVDDDATPSYTKASSPLNGGGVLLGISSTAPNNKTWVSSTVAMIANLPVSALVVSAAIAAPSRTDSSPVAKRSDIASDEVVGFDTTVADDTEGDLMLQWQPYLYVVDGCVPFPAVDAEGNTRSVKHKAIIESWKCQVLTESSIQWRACTYWRFKRRLLQLDRPNLRSCWHLQRLLRDHVLGE